MYCTSCGARLEEGHSCLQCSSKANSLGRLAVVAGIIFLVAIVLAILIWHNRQNYVWRFVGMCFVPNILVSFVMLVRAVFQIKGQLELPVVGKLARKCSLRRSV